MARAVAGYYAPGTAFGRAGDFTTAPEIAQAFGECLGLWAAVVWEAMGRPDPVLLVELGPGRGTLMADALRALAEVAAPCHAALRVHLVEASAGLRATQAARLGGAVAGWHDGIATLPEGPAIILGNEFLDALPIRQFHRIGGAWHERHVAAGAFLDLPTDAPLPDAPDGTVLEAGAARDGLATDLGARVVAQGGAALLLDYGPATTGPGDSLQGVRSHAPVPVLTPDADLSAHVDFATLAAAARAAGAAVAGPLPQGLFLARLGLRHRTGAIAATALAARRPDQARLALSGAERLLAPEGMGRLFKAIALCHPALLPHLPGFAP